MKGTVVYFSHGGGPLPVLGDPGHKNMIDFMCNLPAIIKRPEKIIVFSAHWEEPQVSIISSRFPELYYDYYGFPEESYSIKYDVPGDPILSAEVAKLVKDAGFSVRFETKRGIDHGVFIPLKMMYPEADIPTVQISLIKGLDPEAHLNLGKAVSSLVENENILVIGSGFSFHNMREFFNELKRPDIKNDEFRNFLINTICAVKNTDEMFRVLKEWEKAPSARYCHPREEHLLPLHVCAGAAGKNGDLIFDDFILGKRSVAFKWD